MTGGGRHHRESHNNVIIIIIKHIVARFYRRFIFLRINYNYIRDIIMIHPTQSPVAGVYDSKSTYT